MQGLICRSKVKKFVLDEASKVKVRMGNGEVRYTRVSRDFLDNAEADFAVLLRRKVASLPSVGRTIN